ncbi:MAG: glucose/galactose MFS transporter, partial [Chitinophagaceae bacterium]|nr:glucose/galactose MFS transporter [Chitinophagaceae bacterium]
LVPLYMLAAVQFFLSIMFPTIFALSVQGLGARTKYGSSLVIMAIVGGAIFPVIMGFVSDKANIQTAYVVPAACLLMVLVFALKNMKRKNVLLTAAH